MCIFCCRFPRVIAASRKCFHRILNTTIQEKRIYRMKIENSIYEFKAFSALLQLNVSIWHTTRCSSEHKVHGM